MLNTDLVQVKEADINDLDSVIRIHKEALPNDVFVSLGYRFLHDFYFRTLGDARYNLEVAKINTDVLGFCLLSDDPGSILKLVRFSTYILVLRLLFTRPRIFFSAVIQSLQMMRVKQLQSAEIAFIAVSTDVQKQGIGSMLIEHVARTCRARGFHSLNTKTANPRLASYYRQHFHAREVASFEVFDQRYTVLEWELRDA